MIKISDLKPILERYCDAVEASLFERCNALPIELYDSETYETIGGLLARQATLSIQLALSPAIWNPHVAPIILRCMMDAQITIQWILEEPKERSKKFVLYGLGQEKLLIENLENREENCPADAPERLESMKAWLNSQRLASLTEVNVGNWAELNTRKMAKECGLEDLYKFGYAPCGAVVHNMWHHISRFNLKPCTNPLHLYHKVPTVAACTFEPEYVIQSALHLEESFIAVDSYYSLGITTPSPSELLVKDLNKREDDSSES